MSRNKLTIIFIIFLSFIFFVFGGLYYFKDEVPEEKNILQTTQEEILIFQQKIDDYQQKVNNEKRINQENIKKNIETLKNLGIWDWFKKDYKEYLDAVESSQKTAKLKLNELLKKVKKEKNLASFREELEKLRQERKKDIDEKVDILVKISEKMKEEVEKPMPFFATWTAVILLSIICTIICTICCFRKIIYENGNILSFFGASFGLSFALEIIIIILFCILLKPNRFREAHKRHFSCPKALFLLLIPVIIPLICCVCVKMFLC